MVNSGDFAGPSTTIALANNSNVPSSSDFFPSVPSTYPIEFIGVEPVTNREPEPSLNVDINPCTGCSGKLNKKLLLAF